MAALRLSQFCTGYDDDLRPQLVSWAIAIAAGAAWLALVYLTPAAVVPAGPAVVSEPDDVVALWDGGAAKATRRVEDHGRLVPKPSIATLQKAELTVAGAFATTLAAQVTDNVAAVIRGVQAVQGRASGNDASGKTALSAGTLGSTPGMGTFGKGSDMGQVSGGGAIRRATLRAQPLPVVVAPEPGRALVDPAEAGAFVRASTAQLQYCYERNGGRELAGVVTIRLSLGAGGAVRDAEVVRHTWSGAGAAETEACLLAVVRQWRVPTGSAGATLTLPISFTR